MKYLLFLALTVSAIAQTTIGPVDSISDVPGLQTALDLKLPKAQIKRLALVGDSITNYTSSAIGTFPTGNYTEQNGFGYGGSIQIWSKQSLELVRDAGLVGSASGGQDLDFGHSGQGAAVIRSGVLVNALATDADAIFLMAGTNDTSGAATAAEIMTLIESCWTDIIAAGKIPIAATIIPRRSDVDPAITTKTHAVNALMRTRATALGVALCDWQHVMQAPGAVVGATGLGATQFYDDGTHPNMWGGVRMGNYAADFIASNFQTTPFERPKNYITKNPIGRGVTGLNSNLPTGWEASAAPAGATVTYAVVPRTDGHPGNWTEVVISGATASTTSYTQIFIRTSGTSLAGYNVGDGFRGFAEIVDVSKTFHNVGIVSSLVAVGDMDRVRWHNAGFATLTTTDYPDHSGYYLTELNEVKAGATGFFLSIRFYGNGTIRIGEAGIYQTWR